MKFTIYQESRIGKRASNQDRIAYCYSRDALLMVVADGMGGHLHGEVAAQIAVQFITQAFQREAQPLVGDPVLFLSHVMTNAHHAILDYAFDKYLPEAPRTTVVACLIQNGQAYWAHAGDSRLYLLRKGEIEMQTRDHSRVQLMLDQGLIDAEGAAVHPGRNRIYSCLGGNHSPQVEFSRPTPLFSGDILALCTDGVWGPVGTDPLKARLLDGRPLMKSIPKLLDEAEERGGAHADNLSMIGLLWLQDFAETLPDTVSTQTMAISSFTTQMESFERTAGSGAQDLTDDEIEQAISEINVAIKKFTSD
ncbi:MAG: serine/threonine-protein phosphatase [Denitromonas halophila]|nr:MAG: serine/threonine-protein phosphatase [Denitromonas halophila]TVT71223.1 MAG: serine/threonine-protein phosphatase [Denitromonas halophila]